MSPFLQCKLYRMSCFEHTLSQSAPLSFTTHSTSMWTTSSTPMHPLHFNMNMSLHIKGITHFTTILNQHSLLLSTNYHQHSHSN